MVLLQSAALWSFILTTIFSARKLMEHVVSSQLLYYSCCVMVKQLCTRLFKDFSLPYWVLFGFPFSRKC